jgi:hypothetical protein
MVVDKNYGESLQVLPHEKYGFRSKIQMYRVKRDAIAGTGQALSPDTEMLGSGGGTQFFLSNYKKFWDHWSSILGCKMNFDAETGVLKFNKGFY